MHSSLLGAALIACALAAACDDAEDGGTADRSSGGQGVAGATPTSRAGSGGRGGTGHDDLPGSAGIAGSDSAGTGGSAGSAGSGSTGPLMVQTQYGPVRGMALNRSRVFRGVRYAKAPVGELRFASPEPPEPWTEAPEPAATICPQAGITGIAGTEDCLTLDVWTPLEKPARALPVMVWIHGGSFVSGSGWIDDASGLTARGAIVVGINYRLGPLGFLAHPALTAEGGGTSGNYAVEDQRMALAWVRDNAAAFGGDPERVTIFGESAGGSAVCAHLWSTRSAGLFHRAILQSGALCGRQSRTLRQGEAQGEQLAEMSGCGTGEAAIDCLRQKPLDAFLNLLTLRTLIDDGASWQPLEDGMNFAEPLPEALAGGRFNKVPTLIGSNANEGLAFILDLAALTPEEYAAKVRASAFFGSWADELLKYYPVEDFESPQLALAALIGHRVFNCPARRAARAIAATDTRAYLYHYSQPPALHASELALLFGEGATPGDQLVADAMKDYWTRFAASGDPNGTGDPAWERYDSRGDSHLILSQLLGGGAKLYEPECDLWDEIESGPPP